MVIVGKRMWNEILAANWIRDSKRVSIISMSMLLRVYVTRLEKGPVGGLETVMGGLCGQGCARGQLAKLHMAHSFTEDAAGGRSTTDFPANPVQ
jgi:hypothetical protein